MVQNKYNDNLPSLFSLFSYNSSTPAQKNPPNWRVHHPLYAKKNKNHLPQNVCFQIMKENMFTSFFLYFAHVASIRNPPTPLTELIWSQNPSLSCFLSKKTYSHWHLGISYCVIRERLHSPICQRGIERLKWKVIVLCSQPHHNIFNAQSGHTNSKKTSTSQKSYCSL